VTNYEEISTKVECVKLGMRHTKDGHVISLAINPVDTPQELMTDPLGTRYLAVMVRLNDQEEAVPSPTTEDGAKAVRLAGALCSNIEFQSWMATNGFCNDATEDSCAAGLRQLLGIASRKELKVDAVARRKLNDIKSEFMATYR